MYWAMIHGHYISIEMREKQSHSRVEVTVVIPLHNRWRVTSLASLNCTEIFYLLYCNTMQASQSVGGSWTQLLQGLL